MEELKTIQKTKVTEEKDLIANFSKIACPKCGYEPKKHDLWICHCHHVWNTFDTAGKCPKCGKQWEDTQCTSCKKWSPHIKWYGDKNIKARIIFNNN